MIMMCYKAQDKDTFLCRGKLSQQEWESFRKEKSFFERVKTKISLWISRNLRGL